MLNSIKINILEAGLVMNTLQPQLFIIITLMCIMIVGCVFIVFYIQQSNQKIKAQLKQQQEEELESFKSTIHQMNRDTIKNIAELVANSRSEELNDHHTELLNTFSRLRTIIKDDLYNTMNNTDSCRTALYLLHNGQRSTTGISFIKVSCVGERTLVGSGIKEQIINHSNMPINIFDNMLVKLMENGRYVIMNDEETMQSARSQFISAPKVMYSQAVSIFDSNNNILGFILSEYDHSYNKPTADDEYKAIRKLTVKISPILAFSDYINLNTIEESDAQRV